MSVPAFLEHSYNSACPECGLAGWEHEETCSQAEPAPIALVASGPDAIGYHCCYCGGTFDATPADIAAARGAAEDVGDLDLTDAEAFRQQGRDVCDECIPKFRAEQIAARIFS